jgi:dipeptidyl aminopeptidase/acylaminoacyl peptidase
VNKTIAPYGSWKSPITTDLLTSSGIGLGQIEVCSEGIYWLEGRPLESGRVVVVHAKTGDAPEDVLAAPFNARTRVHEYGGGAYFAFGNTIFFSNFPDQALYRLDDGGEPRPITPEPNIPAGLRYADGRITPDGKTIICVREEHRAGTEATNDLVAISTDKSAPPRSLEAGADFFASPRISRDGRRLAWITWNHPQMPWDGTDLWVADIGETGDLWNTRHVAGGNNESIFQPEWSLDGRLHFISDRTGWWNLYAERNGEIVALTPMDSEFGLPQWLFGYSRYAFLSDGRIACVYSRNGLDSLGVLNPVSKSIQPIQVPYDTFVDLRSDGAHRLFFIAASASTAPEVVSLDLRDGTRRVIRRSMQVDLDAEDLSVPEPIEFPTERGLTSFALFYRPKNKNFTGPTNERPPLLVLSHGGPTSATSSALKLAVQYWTSRGFAVVDVNYGGSTGYGRAYRERLNGMWGVVDMEDCINAARYLERRGDVDGKRMAIRGGSAGGYTTLCALVFSNVFGAGASYFGVADLKGLMEDTHKFESRYLDRMVGPYPEAAKLYHDRSPVHFADRLSCPVILFQGLEDKVVPPAQAETMIAALQKKNLPFAYVVFETEGHGFRQAVNIKRSAEAELYFYSRVFGFTPADLIEPVKIDNLS